MLAFIDEIVIPFLNSLYGAVGYVGVMLAMAMMLAAIAIHDAVDVIQWRVIDARRSTCGYVGISTSYPGFVFGSTDMLFVSS